MRKIDVSLIATLNKGAENQVIKKNEPAAPKTTYPEVIDMSYDKGHNVPEGIYLVKLLDIKCHSTYYYKMKIEILNRASRLAETEDHQVITGYANRHQGGYYDLADCFSGGVLHKSTKKYIGGIGFVSLSQSGWISLFSRTFNTDIFPNFKPCKIPSRIGYDPIDALVDKDDEYSKRFEIENPL